MSRELEEQLEEAAEHLSQARIILSDLADTMRGEGSSDDEPGEAEDVVADLDGLVASVEEIEQTMEDLRESVQE